MENRVLDKYILLVEFLAEVLGDNYEIVLHDLSDYENSIAAIANGHISGRKVGDSLTDLALNVLKDQKELQKEYLTNYTGKTYNGKELRSSTFFIRDDQDKVIAMLCINIDMSDFIKTRDLLNDIIGDKNEAAETQKPGFSENFTSSIEDLIDNMIENSIKNSSIPPKRMTADEKKEITNELDEQGVFLLKNSVSKVAKKLESSEATIYRYLNK